MPQTTDTVLKKLNKLLDDERAALVAGDFDRIDELAREKGILLDQLAADMPASGAALAPLQLKLRRNRALFEQALEGLRAVADRLAELRAVGGGGETYDGEGRRQKIKSTAQSTLEKRA
ncbi:flagellar protein FlgN [Roseivivax isoporae]|uniref:FlgN-like protein n=1 Tax=Roseivivax isoporae LMG 25204 TaxID=1449351 RepID=X7FA67_9RHOB|nr:flagellar protein FlgN [Roseivivax isoporae]ETX29700.1 FlgN-like protein [Roseivivax isoporae LMG 25204]